MRRMRTSLAACAIAAISSASLIMPGISMTSAMAAAPDCQFGNGYGLLVDSDPVYSPPDTTTRSIGRIQLCRDSDYQYWGFILLNNSPTASQYGDAEIGRYRDGNFESFVNCDSVGGNGVVVSGQRRCWTPKFTGVSGRYTFMAYGSLWSSHTGNKLADGTTARTR